MSLSGVKLLVLTVLICLLHPWSVAGQSSPFCTDLTVPCQAIGRSGWIQEIEGCQRAGTTAALIVQNGERFRSDTPGR